VELKTRGLIAQSENGRLTAALLGGNPLHASLHTLVSAATAIRTHWTPDALRHVLRVGAVVNIDSATGQKLGG
jgi:hypothetical protein